MDVFFLMVCLALLFVMSNGGVHYWAVMSGKFEDSAENASVILQEEDAAIALHDSERGREAMRVPSAKSSLPMR